MLTTFVFTALFGFPLQQALTMRLPRSLWILAFLVSSPATSGPVIALIFWFWNRQRDREFAIGAVYFGVAAFLLVGGCLVAFGR
ncbi:MAG: hypothetical protein ACYC6Y_28415 [Thermoguttaceae bacterium]